MLFLSNAESHLKNVLLEKALTVWFKNKPFINPDQWWGRLNSWVVSHLALIISTLRHALGHEFEPWWQQTLYRTQAQHLCFIHDSIWFIWFDTIICLSNLSCEVWNRKLKIKEIYLIKTLTSVTRWLEFLLQLDHLQSLPFASQIGKSRFKNYVKH